MNSLYLQIGKNIAELLHRKNRTQAELAEHVGVSQAAVSAWISGIKAPRLNKVDSICSFLECSRSDILPISDSYISNTLKYLREERNLSQRELAIKLGIAPATIGMYESGHRFPSREIEEKLSDFFGVSIDYLRGNTNDLAVNPYVIKFASYPEDLQEKLIAYAEFLKENNY